ncbi:MAG: hypothetical protein E7295_13925 [Lachnospiraceae bacterium]|nr:hypothetical protein [Lachnospiraceae bacterium]
MAVSEAKRKNNDKYNAKCDYISIRPLKPIGEKIREAAKKSGKSLQGYILDAIDRQITEEECGAEIPPELVSNAIEWLREHNHNDAEIVDFMRKICKKEQ